MLNYFFTIKSHIIDLFIIDRGMQYRLEVDVVPLVGGDGAPLGLAMAVAWRWW